MYLLYADDAGNTGVDYDNEQQPVFCLGGVIVPDDQWHSLNQRIRAWKCEHFNDNPNAELHAVEIFNGMRNRKTGMNFRQYSEEQNLSTLESIVKLIVEMSMPFTVFTVQKQNLKAYCRAHYGTGVKVDPYFIALPYVLSFFDSFLITRKTRGIVFLDEQDQVYSKIDSVLDSFRVFTEGSSILKSEEIIERAMFLQSDKSNFVQIADVCNFIINRKHTMALHHIKPEREKDKFIIRMYDKLRPLILDPPFNPKKHTDVFKFFDDNYRLMG